MQRSLQQIKCKDCVIHHLGNCERKYRQALGMEYFEPNHEYHPRHCKNNPDKPWDCNELSYNRSFITRTPKMILSNVTRCEASEELEDVCVESKISCLCESFDV